MRKIFLWFTLILLISLMAGCGGNKKEEDISKDEIEEIEEIEEVGEENDMPILNIGYTYSNHHAPLIVAAAKNEQFKDQGIYLKEVVAKERYILISDEEEKVNINLIAARNGEEVIKMMGQGDLQMGIASIDSSLTANEEEHKIKILAPINVDGIGLVMPEDAVINNVNEFITYVRGQNKRIRIGYQSPNTVPKIIFETAMTEMGITMTENVDDISGDIVLIDLKETANLIPSLESEHVDGWVGFSPFPELAEVEDTGRIIWDARDLPPIERWKEFPCSVVSATDDVIKDYPKEIEQILNLLANTSEYANENKDDLGKITAGWIGVSEEAAINTTTVYTTEPSQKWLNNVSIVFEYLKDSGKVEGKLKDKIFYFVKDL